MVGAALVALVGGLGILDFAQWIPMPDSGWIPAGRNAGHGSASALGTALGLLFAGAALLFADLPYVRMLARPLALLALMAAGLELSGLPVALLFSANQTPADSGAVGTTMAAPTGVGIVVAGCGTLVGWRWPLVMAACGVVVAVIGLVGMTGLAAGMNTSLLWSAPPPDLCAVLSLFVLGVSLYASAYGRVAPSGRLRGWVGALGGATAVVVATLYTWQLLHEAEAARLERFLVSTADRTAAEIRFGLRERLAVLRTIAEEWSRHRVPVATARDEDARLLMERYDGLCRIETLGSRGEILGGYPSNTKTCRMLADPALREAVAVVSRTSLGPSVVQGHLQDGRLGLRLIVRFRDLHGASALALVVDAESLFRQVVRGIDGRVFVSVSAGGKRIQFRKPPAGAETFEPARASGIWRQIEVALYGSRPLTFEIEPSRELLASLRTTTLPTVVLCFGLAVALLLGSALRLRYLARLRQGETELLNIELEDRVHERTRELGKSNEDLSQFASFLSHELRQPLGALGIWAELLQNRYSDALDERGRRYVGEIGKAVERIAEMVSSQLSLARVGAKPVEMQHFSLNDLVAEIIDELKHRLESASATVEVTRLPALDADRSAFYQVFRNLIENSIKYQRQDVPLSLAVRARAAAESDGICTIEVSDNGRGFATQDAERIFGHTQRLDSTLPGSGVGLAICKSIIERHGGTIRAEGRLGNGARFLVLLPNERCTWRQEVVCGSPVAT